MENKKIVVALGGNALSVDGKATAEDQQAVAKQTAKHLVNLIKDGAQLTIVHGNGPQIGNIILHEEAINTEKAPTMPIDTCSAMSQGQIGYWLQNSIKNVLIEEGMSGKNVATIVTQVVVDPNDPAFNNPSKPIGSFYTEDEAKKMAAEKNVTVKEDAGRGWRRVIPSPKPISIVEGEFIRKSVEDGNVIICSGGGGVPVKNENGQLIGIEGVIDKDFAAAKVAHTINADMLLILTAVDFVSINYKQPNEIPLTHITVTQAYEYISQNQFADGSMLQKVQAAINFLENKPNGKVIITSPNQAINALSGLSGTLITA